MQVEGTFTVYQLLAAIAGSGVFSSAFTIGLQAALNWRKTKIENAKGGFALAQDFQEAARIAVEREFKKNQELSHIKIALEAQKNVSEIMGANLTGLSEKVGAANAREEMCQKKILELERRELERETHKSERTEAMFEAINLKLDALKI